MMQSPLCDPSAEGNRLRLYALARSIHDFLLCVHMLDGSFAVRREILFLRLRYHLCAAQMPYLLFTRLEDFRARGSEASPYFTVTHHQDLAESKGLVLVRGDIVFTSQLSDSEVIKP